MKHLHTITGTTYQIGQLVDDEGRSYDISVITNWPELDEDSDDADESVKVIDFYFGEYDKQITDSFIDQFIEKQNQIKKSIEYLEKLKTLNAADADIYTTIDCLKAMLVKLF